MIHDSVISCVGSTSMVRLDRCFPDSDVEVVAKLEMLGETIAGGASFRIAAPYAIPGDTSFLRPGRHTLPPLEPQEPHLHPQTFRKTASFSPFVSSAKMATQTPAVVMDKYEHTSALVGVAD